MKLWLVSFLSTVALSQAAMASQTLTALKEVVVQKGTTETLLLSPDTQHASDPVCYLETDPALRQRQIEPGAKFTILEFPPVEGGKLSDDELSALLQEAGAIVPAGMTRQQLITALTSAGGVLKSEDVSARFSATIASRKTGNVYSIRCFTLHQPELESSAVLELLRERGIFTLPDDL